MKRNDSDLDRGNGQDVKVSKTNKIILPIGRTARIAFQINELRAQCCEAAQKLATEKELDESELEECARLDDALAEAQRLLKGTVSSIIISRLKRRSRFES